ncbi:MAG: hypothetical protein QOF09_494 [Alphaproteobacteria bacterium]|jgi:hypothetical protein|nr:hypothetical protein [Alphaproteobacteria bacterium]
MLKFAIAGAVLAFGLAATNAPAIAAPRNDCVDCPVSDKYDSEELVEKIRNIKQQLANEALIDVRATRRIRDDKPAAGPRHHDCADCPPPRKYDSQEVVKKVRNIDHSRVINTRTVVPVRTRVRETNHLVTRKNETRHVGVIRHNRIIVEKEIRYVRRVPVETRVEFITHKYRAVERPDSVTVPVGPRTIGKCSNRGGLLGTYGYCGPALRVRG